MPNNDYANEPNQSRSEDIIQSILDNTEYDEAARSRIEYLLIELKNAIEGGGGGGGGGVTSYSPLTEKPKIDNHTLQAGNNTSSDLGLQTKIDSDHKLSADNVDDTNSTNKFNVKSDWNAASGATSEILNKPTLGTASAKNVPASGNAATGEVVLGSDTRLTDARNAKDVYNWAKQENKPSYSYSEIQNTPTIPDELADLADDSTHRTVTDTEKNTWSGKQNALTFDDAPTSNSNNPVKSGGVYTALSAKQNTLSEAQMAAANSGITSTDVAQITTNKNNILYIEKANGKKNLIPHFDTIVNGGCTYTYSAGTVTVTGNKSGQLSIATLVNNANLSNYGLTAGDQIVLVSDNANIGTVVIFEDAQGTQDAAISAYNEVKTVTIPSGRTKWYVRLQVKPATTGTINETAKPMICDKKLYDIDPTVTPYALSNVELTAKEQANENNISSLTQYGGGINKFQVTATTTTINGITFTVNADKTITATGSIADTTQGNAIFTIGSYTAVSGDVLSEGFAEANSKAYIYARGGSTNLSTVPYRAILAGDIGVQRNYACVITVEMVGQVNITFKPMICNSDSYAKSGVYQPYALSNAELTAKEQVNKNNISLLIDNSVKNVLCIERDAVYALNRSLTWSGNTCSYNGVDYTFENGVITVNTPTAATATSYVVLSQSVDSYCNNQYILSGHSGNVRIYVAKGNYFKEDDGNGIILTPTSETNVGAIIRVDAGETVNNLVITPMIRPITTDSTFEKYAPSNRELYEMILALQS